MKKIFFAILGAVLLSVACSPVDLYVEQNPYRTIIEYTPGSFTAEAPGNITPDEDYGWISFTQSGKTVNFTVRRNTTGGIRTATFTIAGKSDKLIVFQKAHGLDVKLNASFLSQTATTADLSCIISSDDQDDYTQEWGFVLSKTADVTTGSEIPMTGKMAFGYNEGTITGLQSGVDYFAWAYAVSTEGDRVYSNMVAILPPVYVRAGEDIQAALDGAKEYATVMVQGGCTFKAPKGGFQFGGSNINKTLSGGWDASFSSQSMDNLTVIDGQGANRGFNCANTDDSGLKGYAKISYFEIINCAGDHGSAIHAVGGPVTVNNCYVHDNQTTEKGAIGTNEGGPATTLTVYNCIVSNNGANGHGPAFGFGEGNSNTNMTVATLVSNLIVDNVSSKKDGYASSFICYNQTELIFVNNTVVGNKNWAEYSGAYSGMVLRGDVRSVFVNNIMVGNYTSPCTKEMPEPIYERQNQYLNIGGGAGTVAYNIMEGDSIKESGNATIENMTWMPLGFDLTDVLTRDYRPVGVAVGSGTLGKISYKSKVDSDKSTLDVKGLLEQYNKDMAGNPRTSNGKVDMGCYQAQ